ncbi:prepilin peptidase [Thermoflavimicrobium dichotomicum]|uniref:Leader peptidase (Prepilin peptidase) / N-methyltransferase n=1 Tax=Thermoflavimicrobium dichotomicum TaxID=46223 RepID=A0A1I3R9M6_9BACL|nr:A24 family peptidase [Thermoflavimicrobium dichotomicum]SFJ42047.1 leader peptidase (prepilin peptidase) / N-methyltransferase [Thermoflavimicrobium dichotomicum]
MSGNVQEWIYILISMGLAYHSPSIVEKALHWKMKQLSQDPCFLIPKTKRIHLSVCFITGIAAYFCYEAYAYSPEKWLGLFFIWILVMVSLTDIWSGLILNLFTYSGFAFFFCFRLFVHDERIDHYLMAAFLAGIGSCLLSWLTKSLGYGDVKLLVMGGIVTGWPNVLIAFWLATLVASLYIGWQWFWGRPVSRKTEIRFGPHLSFGLFIAYLWGEKIRILYFSYIYSLV